MRRREVIALLGGAAAWPLPLGAQQAAMPVVGFLSGRSLASDAHLVDALWPKRLELVRQLATPASLVALLVNPDSQTTGPAIRDLQGAARGIGQNVLVLNVRTERDFDAAFATLIQERVGALVVADDAVFMNRREKLAALAALHAVPAIYGRREFPAAGGLMSYGASTADQDRQSGIYAGRIVKGAKPADLPFLQPTKFELIINLKIAKALGLDVPWFLQQRADEVIE